jgi:hypothetical protein
VFCQLRGENRRPDQERIHSFIHSVVRPRWRQFNRWSVEDSVCYSYSNLESARTDCSGDLWISNKSIRQSKPRLKVTNTRKNIFSKILPSTSMHFATRVKTWRVARLYSVQCTVQWNSSISETVPNRTHVHIHFLLRMTDTMTSQNIDLSSGTLCILEKLALRGNRELG